MSDRFENFRTRMAMRLVAWLVSVMMRGNDDFDDTQRADWKSLTTSLNVQL